MREGRVVTMRIDDHASIAHCKGAEIALDTDVAGRTDAFNPAERLLPAIAEPRPRMVGDLGGNLSAA
jgi:hypothetical protein